MIVIKYFCEILQKLKNNLIYLQKIQKMYNERAI